MSGGSERRKKDNYQVSSLGSYVDSTATKVRVNTGGTAFNVGLDEFEFGYKGHLSEDIYR